jgi:2-polyprenyl-3-methyl-5-hydroxy-6-metoxy-1,4-benzoquinol methylase
MTAKSSYAGHRLDFSESRLRKLAALVQEEPRGRLLDIGCADGTFAARLAADGWRVEGVEREPAQVEAAARRGVAAQALDFGCRPFPWSNGTFDAVVAGEVIEHVLDTDHLLGEIARVLRSGGALLITTPNLASFENRLRLLWGRYPMWMDVGLEGSGHVRYYTPRILAAQLARHGLAVERHVGNWVPFVPQRWLDDRRAPWLSITGDWWPSLAMDIIMKARRRPDAPAR